MEKLKHLKKKKLFVGGAATAVILIAALVAGLIFRGRSTKIQAAEMTVQSATAETGSISTTVVGTGTLSGGAATDIVVPVGVKVKEVLVESGDTVTAGQHLATLDAASIASELLEVNESIETVQDEISNLSGDTSSDTTEFLEATVLDGKLEELTSAQAALSNLLNTQVITASCAGTISSINVSADTEITKSSGSSDSSSQTVSSGSTSSGNSVSKLSTSGSQYSVISLSTATGSSGVAKDVGVSDDTSLKTLKDEEADADTDAEKTSDSETVLIETCSIDVTAPVTGQTPQSEITENDEYTGTISWNCSTDTFQADTVYTAELRLTARSGYEFSGSILPEVKGADVTAEVLKNDAGDSILRIKAKFAKTGAETNDKDTSGNTSLAENSGEQNTQDGALNNSSSGSIDSGTVSSDQTDSLTGSLGGSTAGSSSIASSASAESTSTGSQASDYSPYETAAFSIASQDQAAVSINVDELDILSVKEGQTATITLDALEGQEFEGTIKSVASTATSGSSSAKYQVEITLDKTDDMKLGMSASATLHIDEANDAILIPVNALQEKSSSTFVYTGKDDDGNLTDEVEVETGLSNGSQVAITSGLQEGDTVYYLKADSSDSSNGSMPDMMGGFGGGSMPDGEMPSGGAPSGMSPGGEGGGRQDKSGQTQ